MTYFVVRENGVVWIDGAKKRNPPTWISQLPDGDFRGYVLVEADGSIIFEREEK